MPVPTFACGLVRIKVLGPDAATVRGTLAGINAAGVHSKAWGESALSFTANALEAALASDPDLLEDAFAVVELDIGGVWTPVGTPFLLAPGEGTVLGPSEGSAREHTPVAVGALKGLLDELIVLPNECDDDSPTLRYACGIEGNRYLGWMSKGYTEDGTWNTADVFTPGSGGAKFGQPENWDANASPAAWVYRNASGEGGLTLLRFGTFTLTQRTVVKFIASADEEMKVYLDGPNMGGVIIDSTANETGYTEKHVWKKRLEPGTYRVSAEFTTVDSAGGDGNDSMRFACGPVGTDGEMSSTYLVSSSSTKVRRQPKNNPRPGMSLGEVIRHLLEDNSGLGCTGADILLDSRTFGDLTDSAGQPWADGQEWVWPLGTSLSSVLADFSEDADFDLDPSFAFSAWNDRGTTTASALVKGADPPTATMNVVEYGWTSEPTGPTRYLTLSQDGYDIHVGTDAELSTRPRFGFFESGGSGSIGRAKSNAAAAIRQNGRIRRYYTARIMAVAGSVPFDDFTVCDTITALDKDGNTLALEVLSIGWAQPSENDPQSVLFTLELAEVD